MLAEFKQIALNADTPKKFSDSEQINAENILKYYGFTHQETIPDYKKFWPCVYGLIALWIFFRVMVVVSLALQESKFGESGGDTRNQEMPADRRDKTLVVVQGGGNANRV